MLGLRHNTNVLVDYDPQWPDEFAAESQRIADALGPLCKAIEHCGSTSVPGMRANPILNIIIGLDPFSDWQACHAAQRSACSAGLRGAQGQDRGRGAGQPGAV